MPGTLPKHDQGMPSRTRPDVLGDEDWHIVSGHVQRPWLHHAGLRIGVKPEASARLSWPPLPCLFQYNVEVERQGAVGPKLKGLVMDFTEVSSS